MKPVKSRKIRTLNQRFKQFGEIDAQDVEYTIDANGNTEVKQVKYFRVPCTLEPLMEKTNIAWRFYSKKFMKNPTINMLVNKLSHDGDIERTGNLKLLLDMKEQMGEYKKKRDLDGMVQTMRTMYSMLQIMGYKKGPHASDEYTDVNMRKNAELLLKKYGIKKPDPVIVAPKRREVPEVDLTRRVMPTLIATDIVGVSPMVGPDPEFLRKLKELDHPNIPAINLDVTLDTEQKE